MTWVTVPVRPLSLPDRTTTLSPFLIFAAPITAPPARAQMIFMKPFERSSRTTGPKIRVPIGSSFLFTSTAALVSKRITLPSGRRTSLRVRTITAR